MQDAKTKKIYVAAFEGTKKADGGEVLHCSGHFAYERRTLVRAGDVAAYLDGSTACLRGCYAR